jgi:uncharacterized protein YbbC (DUF1343 family)
MRLGLERLLENPKRWLGNSRIGLIANPTSVDRQLNHAVDLMHRHRDIDLCLVFGPEHGLRGCAQDMIGVDDARDPATGLPEISLYGKSFDSLSPRSEHLSQIDGLVFDVQDVGARYYTYAATMALCMRAAKSHSVKMVVLDRPNPIGGLQIEGGGVDAGLESFCGLFPIPQRHAMTVGELARLYNGTFGIGADLEVVECEGWHRAAYYDDCDLPWIMPSPNLPTLDTAIVYPGMCLLEGTNLSEGRGTTRPFELVGAPFIDARTLAHKLSRYALSGVRFRPCVIEPVFHKWSRQRCQALQLHITDRRAFDAYRTGIALLVAVKSLWPDDFAWRTEPYEFRDDVPAIDLLVGTSLVRAAIDDGKDLDRVMQVACTGTELYDAGRNSALLYG